MVPSQKCLAITAVTFAELTASIRLSAAEPNGTVREAFDADPQCEGFRNKALDEVTYSKER